jgi:hypothetical protein
MLIAVLAAPAAAHGVIVGSDLTAESVAGGTPGTLSPSATISGAHPVSSPIDGVINTWHLKGGTAAGSVRLRLIDQLAGGLFIAPATGPTHTVALATGLNTIREFHLEPGMPIRAGQRIAIDDGPNADPICGCLSYDNDGGTYDGWTPILGSTPTAPSFSSNRELLMNVEVEPDADGDLSGDETHDKCPTQTNSQGLCQSAFTVSSTSLKKGQVQLNVAVPGPGTIEVEGTGKKPLLNDAGASAAGTKPGTQALVLFPTKAAKAKLKKKKSAGAQVTVTFTAQFTTIPTFGAPVTQTASVKLKK